MSELPCCNCRRWGSEGSSYVVDGQEKSRQFGCCTVTFKAENPTVSRTNVTRMSLSLRLGLVGRRQQHRIIYYFLCSQNKEEKSTKKVHEVSCPGTVRAEDDVCREVFSCARRYATESRRNGRVSKLEMTLNLYGKGEEWYPLRHGGNAC